MVPQAWNWGHEDLWGKGSEKGKRLLAPTEPQEEAAPSPGCPAELSSEGEFAPDPGEPWPPSPAQNFLQPHQAPTGYSCTSLLRCVPWVLQTCPASWLYVYFSSSFF